MEQTYPALLELNGRKLSKELDLGINCAQTGKIYAEQCEPDIILMSGRYTLLDQTAADGFLDSCSAHRVSVVVGSPFNSGILAVGSSLDAKYDYHAAGSDVTARVTRIESIARKHGASLRSLALQFPLYHPSVASVIPECDLVRRSWKISAQ